MKHLVGITRNGIEVHVDLIYSEAAKNIAQQPYLLGLANEVLRAIAPRGAEFSIEHDMGRAIGYNFVVATKEADPIFYAQLLHDSIYTRFVKNGKPLATRYLSLVLKLNKEDRTYDLQDAWIGRLNPSRPGSSDETADSKPFWANHALVISNQSLQLNTVTKVCPY